MVRGHYRFRLRPQLQDEGPSEAAEILHHRARRLVLVTKDRLLRFGSELLFRICEIHGVEVVNLDADDEIRKSNNSRKAYDVRADEIEALPLYEWS